MVEIGFVDDDPAKRHARIDGIPVLGTHADIARLCEEHRIEEVIIAIPSASPSRLRHILDRCQGAKAKARILPGVGDLIDGKVSVRALRGRGSRGPCSAATPCSSDTELLKRSITGRTVMVTGAAGSIGSELCRQIARPRPCPPLCSSRSPRVRCSTSRWRCGRGSRPLDLLPVIGDIRDRGRVEEVIRGCRPAIIYHAAAYKHVPMMEMHPVEAVKTNVLGTRILAEVAGGMRRGTLCPGIHGQGGAPDQRDGGD